MSDVKSLKKQKLLHKIKAQRRLKRRLKSSLSVLLRKITTLTDAFKYEAAMLLIKDGLASHPNNIQLLEKGGVAALELGQADIAYSYFTDAVKLSPDKGPSKYLYLGQLTSGAEAVDYLLKGINLLTAEMACKGQQASGCCGSNRTSLDVSSAYCSIAEIYLTDECFSELADEECLKYCQLAISSCPDNPEAHQVMASYLLSKDKKEEARDALCKGVDLWLRDTLDSDTEEDENSSVAVMPSFESRVNCVKLLIEVEELQKAKLILEVLAREDDEVLVVSYLTGWCLHLEGMKKEAKTHFANVVEMSEKYGCDEEDMIKHCQELLEEQLETTELLKSED